MDSWERFDEISLPDRKGFYSELYLEEIAGKDYAYAQKVFEELKLKSLGDYHDLYVQSDILFFADYLNALETSALKYINLVLLTFCLHQD